MYSPLLYLALALTPAAAIPPPDFGFPEAPNDTALSVTYTDNGSPFLVREGQLMGVEVPAQQPQIAIPLAQYASLANYTGQYLVMMVDPDASNPANPTNRWILHWAQPNMTLDTNSISTTNSNTTALSGTALTNATAPFVPYARPMPPPTSPAHRYILYAFFQPPNFTIPASFSGYNASNRTHFNLTSFISAADLGTPAAAMYYYCSNETAVPATFTAAPGATYPGGNQGMITSGMNLPSSTSGTASTTGSASGTGSTSQSASAGGNAASSSSSAGAAPRRVDGVARGAGGGSLLGAFVGMLGWLAWL